VKSPTHIASDHLFTLYLSSVLSCFSRPNYDAQLSQFARSKTGNVEADVWRLVNRSTKFASRCAVQTAGVYEVSNIVRCERSWCVVDMHACSLASVAQCRLQLRSISVTLVLQ
jgi:hypothetical protein